MKSKKSIILILILIIIVILSSCASEKTETDRAKEKVEVTLGLIKAGDLEKFEKETGFDTEILTEGIDENKHMMKLLLSDLSWSFVSGEISEGKGDLVYKVNTKEMEELVLKALSAAFEGKFDLEDTDAAMKYMEEAVKDLTVKEKEIIFNLAQSGEAFAIINMEDVLVKLIGLDSEFLDDEELGDDSE